MRYLITILFASLLIFSVGANEAGAQELVEYTLTFDFTVDEQGWVPGPLLYGLSGWDARYTPGVGWNTIRGSEVGYSADQRNGARITYNFVQPVELTRFNFTHYYGEGAGSTYMNVELHLNGALVETYYSPSGNPNIVIDRVIFYMAYDDQFNPTHIPGRIEAAELRYLDYSQPEEFVRPLTDADYGVAGSNASPTFSKTTFAFSGEVGDIVHSAVGGTVVQIEQARLSQCYDQLIYKDFLSAWVNTPGCKIPIPDIVVEGEAYAGEYEVPFEGSGFRLGAYIVTIIDDSDREWRYWVDKPDIYVEENMRVDAGCPIGETLNLITARLTLNLTEITIPLGITIGSLGENILNQGFTAVKLPDELIGDEIIPSNGIPPEAGTGPCNKPPGFAGCLGSPLLTQTSTWQSEGTVNWLQTGGVRMSENSTIRQQYNLDPAREPEVIVFWRGTVGATIGDSAIKPATLRVRFGEVDGIDINYEGYFLRQSVFSPGGALTANAAGFYELEIHAEKAPLPIEIQWICVHHTLDGEGGELPPQAPTACYFQDASFNLGQITAAWTSSDPSVTFSEGAALLPSTQSISQNVHLYPADDGPQDYYFSMEIGINDISSDWIYDLNDLSVLVEYKWGSHTADTWQALGTYNQTAFIESLNLLTINEVLSVSTEIDAPFEIRATITNGEANVTLGTEIHNVCISSDAWPGYREDIPPDEMFPESCNVITRPEGGAGIGAWINYLWLELDQFFQCDLMVFLNYLYDMLNEALTTMRWFFRYMIVTFLQFTDWLSYDLIYWLNGHYDNIANGRTTFIEIDEDSECNNIFCAIEYLFGGITDIYEGFFEVIVEALNEAVRPLIEEVIAPLTDVLIEFFSRGIDELWNLVGGLINLFFDFVTRVFDLIFSLDDLFVSVIRAFAESEPEQVPMMPYCDTDPESNLVCRFFWALDNSVLTGNGEVIPYLLAGYISIMLAWWVVEEISKVIRRAGNAL